MKKTLIVTASLFSIFTLSGPGTANVLVPCAKASAEGAQLICFCQPGGVRCKCNKVATDDGTGVETW